jgi:hypothetical protein
MKGMNIKPLGSLLLVAGAGLANPAYAVCDGCVVGAVQAANMSITMAVNTVNGSVTGVNASVQAMNQSVSQLLYQVGTAINENGERVANTVETAARTGREFDASQEKYRRREDARQRYHVPQAICSEAASGGAGQVIQAATAAKSSVRAGTAVISNARISAAVNSPSQPAEIDAMRAASIHAQYCDPKDFAAYGGSSSCPAPSAEMPGADKRLDSVLHGAGPDGKVADLTFSQAQTDAAQMYIQNSIRRSIGPDLKKGEAETPAGVSYIGLLTQFLAALSAASEPQEQRLANSQPNPATAELLAEAKQSTSAASYFNRTASEQAKATGQMSAREFESFEVGRRYANTEYQADLQNMSGDNLMREQIRVASLQNWLLLGLKEEVEKNNIISGVSLASELRQEYQPLLMSKYRAIDGAMGGN